MIYSLALPLAASSAWSGDPADTSVGGSLPTMIPGCAAINKDGKCVACLSNYLPDNVSNIAACTQNIYAFCSVASDDACAVCEDGYVLTGGLCAAAVQNCFAMSTTAIQCLQCISGYLPSTPYPTDICSECIGGCPLNCTQYSDGMCTACSPGSYLAESSCTGLPTWCSTGNGSGCMTCMPGFLPVTLPNATNPFVVCEPCSVSNCIQASKGNCTMCMAGYFLVSPNLCESTIENCAEYTSDICVGCKNGTLPDHPIMILACLPCKGPCPAACYSINNDGQCTSCYFQHFLFDPGNGLTICQPLPEGCLTVTRNGECIFCRDGYIPSTLTRSSSNGFPLCYPCTIPHCIAATAPEVCSVCEIGFILTDNTCIESITNCALFDDGFCTVCVEGYLPSSPFFISQCIRCRGHCVPYCASVHDKGVCTACSAGYYLNGEACLDLPYGCGSGTANGTCTQCADGFVPDSYPLTTCYKSPIPFCMRASSLTNCTLCEKGFTLRIEEGVQVCHSNVQNCQLYGNNGMCVKCKSGYLPFNEMFTECNWCLGGVCVQNCLYVSPTDGNCTECIPGYYVTNTGVCATALPGCLVTTPSGVCVLCHDLYAPNVPGNITECVFVNVSNCAVGKDGLCVSCLPGYVYLLQQCYPASPDTAHIPLDGGGVIAIVVCVVAIVAISITAAAVIIRVRIRRYLLARQHLINTTMQTPSFTSGKK